MPADERVHNICKTLRPSCCFGRIDGYMDIVMGRFSDTRSSPTFYLAFVAQVLRTIELSGVPRPPVTRLTFVGSPLLFILVFLEMSQSSTVSLRWSARWYSSSNDEWALRSPAANVNWPALMWLRSRESDEVGPCNGSAYRLWFVAHLWRCSWISMVGLSRGGLLSSSGLLNNIPF